MGDVGCHEEISWHVREGDVVVGFVCTFVSMLLRSVSALFFVGLTCVFLRCEAAIVWTEQPFQLG